jgi:hypothetical protein
MTETPPVKPGLSSTSELFDAMAAERRARNNPTGKAQAKGGKKGGGKKPNFFVSKWQRVKALLSVAEKGELIFLLSGPFWFLFVGSLHAVFGVPLVIQAYFVIVLGFYIGWHFAVWVFLDRRLDEQNWLRFKNAALRLMAERDGRKVATRQAEVAREETLRRTAEALERGRQKAKQRPAAGAAAAKSGPAGAASLLEPDEDSGLI